MRNGDERRKNSNERQRNGDKRRENSNKRQKKMVKKLVIKGGNENEGNDDKK